MAAASVPPLLPYLQAVPVNGLGMTRTVLVLPNGATRLAL